MKTKIPLLLATILAVTAGMIFLSSARKSIRQASGLEAWPADPATRAAEELDIREAIYRHQFGKDASIIQKASTYYLKAGWMEGTGYTPDGIPYPPETVEPLLPASFIRRFAGHRPEVKAASECDITADGVVGKDGTKGGLIFKTELIRWISKDEVKVYGGFYDDNVGSAGNAYYLLKEAGKWKVARDKLEFIACGGFIRLEFIPSRR